MTDIDAIICACFAQIASALGERVVITTSSEVKGERVKELGAKEVIKLVSLTSVPYHF